MSTTLSAPGPPKPPGLAPGSGGTPKISFKEQVALNKAAKLAVATVAASPAPPPTMASPIAALFRTSSGAINPNERFVLPVFDYIKANCRGGSRVTEAMMRRLVTAMCYAEKEGVLAGLEVQTTSIGEFMQSHEFAQYALVDAVWDACTDAHAYTTSLSAMTEPDAEVAMLDKSLPSFIVPGANTKAPKVPYKQDLSVRDPFKTLGVVFRVDGSSKTDMTFDAVGRVQKQGLTAQVLNPQFMLDVRHMTVDGTTIAKNTERLRYYKTSADLFNETGVCVARSFFGATAFPERNSVGNVCLWAASVNGLSGFDTEAVQATKRWRPGEKAYRTIPPSNVIGWVAVKRHGVPMETSGAKTIEGGGWIFEVPPGSAWTYIASASAPVRAYCDAVLAAWTSPNPWIVSTDYDFTTTVVR